MSCFSSPFAFQVAIGRQHYHSSPSECVTGGIFAHWISVIFTPCSPHVFRFSLENITHSCGVWPDKAARFQICPIFGWVLMFFFQPSGDFGLDSTSISATVLSCCQSNEWPAALELLHWTSAMAGCPPTSHALATLISAVEDIPDVEVTCRVCYIPWLDEVVETSWMFGLVDTQNKDIIYI